MLAPKPKWPACSASPARPSPSGYGGSVARRRRTGRRSLTAPAVPWSHHPWLGDRIPACRHDRTVVDAQLQKEETAICAPHDGMLADRPGAAPHRVEVGHRPLHRLRCPAPRRTPPPRVAPSHHTGGRSSLPSMPARGACLVQILDIEKSPGQLGRIPQGGGKRILPDFAETHSGPQRGRYFPPRFRFPSRSRGRPLPLHLRRGLSGRPKARGALLPPSLSGLWPTSRNTALSVVRDARRRAHPDRGNGACYVSRHPPLFTRGRRRQGTCG